MCGHKKLSRREPSIFSFWAYLAWMLKMCRFLLHAKSMQLSLIFWQHFWGQARSCLPCHLPYTLLVNCTYQIHHVHDFCKNTSNWMKKGLEIRSNFTPCKSTGNGSKFSCILVSYPNLIVLVPPDITSFVGWNERNKVGVRDGGGAKRKRSTQIYE